MLFDKMCVIPILLGQMTSTRREKRPRELPVDSKNPKRVYKAQHMLFTPDYFVEFKITEKFQQPLGDMTDQDYKAEGFATREKFIYAWELITKNPIDETQIVWVLKFELVRVSPGYLELFDTLNDIMVDGRLLTKVEMPDPLTPEQVEAGEPEPEIPKPKVIPLVDLDQILFYYPELAKFFPEKKKDLPTEQKKVKPERDSTIDEITARQQYIQTQLQELADQTVEIATENIEWQKEYNMLEHQRRRLLVNMRHSRRHRRIRRATG